MSSKWPIDPELIRILEEWIRGLVRVAKSPVDPNDAFRQICEQRGREHVLEKLKERMVGSDGIRPPRRTDRGPKRPQSGKKGLSGSPGQEPGPGRLPVSD